MRSLCCVSVPRSRFMLCAVSMFSRAVSRHRARCRDTAQQFDAEPQLLRECSVTCLWPLGVKVRSCHNTELCSVSPCGADIPCVQVLRECSVFVVLVIRDFDSRSYYSAAPLSLCHQAGRQCDAGPCVAWVVCVAVSYHTRLQHMGTR